MEKVFSAEKKVIITSNDQVDALQWRTYILKNWENLMQQKDTKVLVLAGIHGEKDGELGNQDIDLLDDYRRQIKYLMGKRVKKEIQQDIKDYNISVRTDFYYCTESEYGGS